jgi:hypothetical protein
MLGLKRRAVLGGVAALSAASGALAAPPARPRMRRDIASLSPNDPDVAALRTAIRKMHDAGAADRRPDAPHAWTWWQWKHQQMEYQHAGWRFLPWHRVMLLQFERRVAELSGYKQFAMPFWDWQRPGTVPAILTDAQNGFGHSNRRLDLATANFNTLHLQWRREPARLLTDNFRAFAGPDRDTAGSIQTSGHNFVHFVTGGDMGDTSTAPLDPFFWFHHCNVDRVWSKWANHGGGVGQTFPSEWLEDSFDGYLNLDGSPARAMTTAEVLNTRAVGAALGDPSLNYDYDPPYPDEFFLEEIPEPPAGMHSREPASAIVHNLRGAVAADGSTVEIRLPAEVVDALVQDKDSRIKLLGFGVVRAGGEGLEQRVISLQACAEVEDASLQEAPISDLFMFAPMSHHGRAPGFSFSFGPELYRLSGKAGVKGLTVTARFSSPPGAPAPTAAAAFDSMTVALTVRQYRWV